MGASNILKKAALAGAFTLGTLTAASAATTTPAGPLVANENYISVGGIVNAPDGEFTYDYVAGEDLTIEKFALSAVGNSDADVENIQASFVPSTGEMVTLEAYSAGDSTVSFGGAFLDGLKMAAGDTFSILFSVLSGASLDSNVGVQVSFDTVDVAPVPVPAAGVLLLSALGAAGFVSRRRKRNA